MTSGVPVSKEQVEIIRQALVRSVELMRATRTFIANNPVAEYTVYYDEAECDGSCLSDDCGFAITEAEYALVALPLLEEEQAV